MKRKNIIFSSLAGVFSLLGIALRVVPGIRFSSNLSLALALLCLLWMLLCHWAEKNRAGKWCKRIFLVGCLVVFLVLCCFEALIIARGEEDNSAISVDAIIVLGAGVNGETPSLTLQTRIRAAAEYMALHPDVPVVFSGGQGPGEDITEAEAMSRALWSNSEEWNQRYILEERSTSTVENLAFSKALLQERGIDTDTAVIGVVTNDFHIFRATLIAEREGMTVVGFPAELPWWWLTTNYYVREAFALGKTLLFD